MKVINLPQNFIDARPILEQLQKHGYEAYFVGGSVRDTLLETSINDVDIATSAYPAEVKNIFKRTVDTGIKHGTVMILDHGQGYEVTTFRTESGYQDFRRPDSVTFVRSLKEDLKRRDLTINALAMDPQGNIIDLFGGLNDLKAKTIKAVGQPAARFHEDALRMMRAVRFVSQLGFTLDNQTRLAIKENAPLLTKIAVERIHVEWIKLMLGKDPQKGLNEFLKTQMFQYCLSFKEHEEGLKKIAQLSNLNLHSEIAVWVLIGHFFGLKPEETGQMLREWKSSNEMIADVVKAQKALNHFPVLNPQVLYQTGLPLLLVANQVAKYENNALSEATLSDWYNSLPIKSKKELQLTGTDLIKNLEFKPGPQIGKTINSIEQLVLNGKLPNKKEALLHYTKTVM